MVAQFMLLCQWHKSLFYPIIMDVVVERLRVIKGLRRVWPGHRSGCKIEALHRFGPNLLLPGVFVCMLIRVENAPMLITASMIQDASVGLSFSATTAMGKGADRDCLCVSVDLDQNGSKVFSRGNCDHQKDVWPPRHSAARRFCSSCMIITITRQDMSTGL